MEPENQEYELSIDERAMIAPYEEQIRALDAERQVILRAILRVRKLEGQWTQDGTKMRKL
jgi:hypothetical protein